MVKTLSQIKQELATRLHSQASDSHGHAAIHEEEKTYTPIFVPMGRAPGADVMNCRGRKDVPVHTTDVLTRGDVMEEITEDSMRSGNIAAAYKAWLLAVVFFVITVATMFVNIYVAAVFAYLTGFYYSERLLNQSWGVEWFKGKSVVYTV